MFYRVCQVCLNIDEFKEAHIVFLLRHRSSNEAKDRAEKHFALSYLRLMQKEGTTTPDTQHNLAVYKVSCRHMVSDNCADAIKRLRSISQVTYHPGAFKLFDQLVDTNFEKFWRGMPSLTHLQL